MEALKMLAVMPAAGAGIGGLIGAARAEKGKRLRTAVGDAGVGALAGLGFGLGGLSGGAAGMALGSKTHPAELQQYANDQNSAALGGLGAGLGAVGAGMLGQKLRKEMEEEYDNNNPMNIVGKIGGDLTMKKRAGDFDGPVTLDVLKDTAKGILPWAVPRASAIGAAGGGIYGGLTGKGALRGALRGGAIGAGVGAGAPLGAGLGMSVTEDTGLADAMFGRGHEMFGHMGDHMFTTMPVGAAAGGVAGGVAGNALYNKLEQMYDSRKNNAPKKDKAMKKTEKKSAASSFGEKIAINFDMKNINWKNVMNTGLGGAALGAGLGGLAGLIAPGEDGQGRRRSRLSSALSGALGGGLLGGGAAAVGEVASPGFGQGAYNYANDLYRQLFGRSNPQAKTLPYKPAPTTAVPMAGGKQMRAHPGTKSLEQIQAERQQYLNPAAQMDEISFPGTN